MLCNNFSVIFKPIFGHLDLVKLTSLFFSTLHFHSNSEVIFFFLCQMFLFLSLLPSCHFLFSLLNFSKLYFQFYYFYFLNEFLLFQAIHKTDFSSTQSHFYPHIHPLLLWFSNQYIAVPNKSNSTITISRKSSKILVNDCFDPLLRVVVC